MADEIAVMQRVIVEIDETQNLFKNMKHQYTRSLQHLGIQLICPSRGKFDPLLTIKNVTCRYRLCAYKIFFQKRLFTAVSNVSFDIKNGERVGLVGESGWGNNLTRAILGLEPIYKGEINDNQNILKATPSTRKIFKSFSKIHTALSIPQSLNFIKEPLPIKDSPESKNIEKK